MSRLCLWMLPWILGVCFSAQAATLTVAGVQGSGVIRKTWEELVEKYEAKTGNEVKILPVGKTRLDLLDALETSLQKADPSIDVYVSDIVWLPQHAEHFVELSSAEDIHFDEVVRALTIEGHQMGIPLFMDAGALYYRKDLLEKYNKPVPTTWREMEETARFVLERERFAGNEALWGYVWQGRADESLTCNIMEWLQSNGGGRIVEPDGVVSINNRAAVAAVERAAGWIGSISPAETLNFGEEESRAVWNEGNALFMRNWPYAYALSEEDYSKVKGKFGIVPLPAGDTPGAESAATLGGWSVSVSKYSENRVAAVELAQWLASAQAQKVRALRHAALPTFPALYDDPDILKAQPALKRWRKIVDNATTRPVSVATVKYSELSRILFEAVHEVLSGKADAATQLKAIEQKLKKIKGDVWLEGTPFLQYAKLLNQAPKGPQPKP